MTFIATNNIILPKLQVSTQTSQQTGSTTANSSIVVNGSQISYEPDTSASTVAYEVAYYCERVNWITYLQNVALEQSTDGGTTWTEINEKYRKNYGISGSAYQDRRYYQHLIYFFPSFTGERQFRISVGTNKSGYQAYFHQLVLWDGAASSTDFTDVNVLMYSIL